MTEAEELFPVLLGQDDHLHAMLPDGEKESDYIFQIPTIEEGNRFGSRPPYVAVKKNGRGSFTELDLWNDQSGPV